MDVYSLKNNKVIIENNLKNFNKKQFFWIRLKSPDSANIAEVAKLTGIDKEDMNDFLDDEERSRVEFSKTSLHIIYLSPAVVDDALAPISFFIKNNLVVSIELERIPFVDNLVKQLALNKKKYYLKTAGKFIYNFLDEVNDKFIWHIDKITRKTNLINLERDLSQKLLVDLYDGSTKLAIYNQAILANLEVLGPLRKSKHKLLTDQNREDFTDLYHDTLQILDRERIQREVITNLFNFQTALSAQKTNQVMHYLSFLAIVVMIPTIVASLYGMNVDLPMANNPYAFWILVGISLLLSLITYFFFRK